MSDTLNNVIYSNVESTERGYRFIYTLYILVLSVYAIYKHDK